MQLARRLRHARLWISTHARGPHLMRAEQRQHRRPSRRPYQGRDELLEVLPRVPAVQHASRRPDDPIGARCAMQQRQLARRAPQVLDVHAVLHRIVRDRLPALVQLDPTVPAVAHDADERRVASHVAHQLLVTASRLPGYRAGRAQHRVVRTLDEQPVVFAQPQPLIGQSRLRGPPPGPLILFVGSRHREGRVQVEMVADRRTPDARALEQRGCLERTACGDHVARAHDHGARLAIRAERDGSDARRAPLTRQDAQRTCAHQDARAAPVRVVEVRVERALARARIVAKAVEARDVRVVLARIDIEQTAPEAVPERPGGFFEALMWTVEVATAIVGPDALEHALLLLLEGIAREPREAVLALPLFAHPAGRAHAVLPVDCGAAAQRGARDQRHRTVRRRVVAAAPVQVLVGPQLELVEVALAVVAACLEHDHIEAALAELAGDHAAARARADDADVGRERQLVDVDLERLDALVARAGRTHRAWILQRRPIGISPRLVGQRVAQAEHQLLQAQHAKARLFGARRHLSDDLLADLGRHVGDPQLAKHVDQSHQSRPHGLGKRRVERLGYRHFDPVVCRLARPEAVRVVSLRQARKQAVAQCAQTREPRVGPFGRHRSLLEGKIDRTRTRESAASQRLPGGRRRAAKRAPWER